MISTNELGYIPGWGQVSYDRSKISPVCQLNIPRWQIDIPCWSTTRQQGIFPLSLVDGRCGQPRRARPIVPGELRTLRPLWGLDN